MGEEASRSQPVISLKRFLNKLAGTNTKKWIWIGLAAVPAIRLYYVREMIAALIIFSVFFVGAATVVLIVFLLDRASQHAMAWAEAGVVRLVHRGRGASHAVASFGKVAH
jgi:hypothetical protein